jgi:hypothetical protein
LFNLNLKLMDMMNAAGSATALAVPMARIVWKKRLNYACAFSPVN